MAEKFDFSASPLPPALEIPNFSTENETALTYNGDGALAKHNAPYKKLRISVKVLFNKYFDIL